MSDGQPVKWGVGCRGGGCQYKSNAPSTLPSGLREARQKGRGRGQNQWENRKINADSNNLIHTGNH